ncbi:substrate-binding domain-containing protein [Gammaproteobacteria bacterium]|nr:substrate-binding domain-containing protein [Gammaproteobacteria bacterium]
MLPVLAFPDSNSLKILSTTSTRDSGFFNHLLPIFEKQLKIKTQVIAVGTGQALQNAKNCDGDILLVHAPNLEQEFINDGYGLSRHNVMYNDFVVIGPSDDPIKINSYVSIKNIFRLIYDTKTNFISRGDNSGTNISELLIWDSISYNPYNFSGNWYLESGQGMGATLNIAIGKDAYTYSDRATWVRFNNKSSHKILSSGDPLMHNQYSLVTINPDHCHNLNTSAIAKFKTWILSKDGQASIDAYIIDNNRLFKSNSDD